MPKKPLATFDTNVLKSFDGVYNKLKKAGFLKPTLAIEQLKESLNEKQREVVNIIIDLNPEDYGVLTPYAGLEAVPSDMVVVGNQAVAATGEEITFKDKYVPRPVYDAFVRMNEAFRAAYPERSLLIESAYRSPATQIITFINWCLRGYDGDIGKTIRHASPPAYSQHTLATKTALDIKNIDGSPSEDNPEDFKHTIEYQWLRTHASEFGFYESWQESNEFNMRAEPWHWQYLGETKNEE